MLLDISFFVLDSCLIFIAFSVDALGLSLKRFFIFLLLVVQVILECGVHLQSRVEPVFDGIIGSSRHLPCNQGPLFAELLIQEHQFFVFLKRPFFFNNIWIKVVVVPLPTLFASTARKLGGNEIPALSPVFFDKPQELIVFFLSPSALLATLHLVLLLKTYILKVAWINRMKVVLG